MLSCRASENLLLTDDVLKTLNITWDELKDTIDNWLNINSSHCHFVDMQRFKDSDYDRKSFDLKNIRNDLMHIIGKPVAWEVAVGKTIGKLISEEKINSELEHSLCDYLGEKLVNSIFVIGSK